MLTIIGCIWFAIFALFAEQAIHDAMTHDNWP